MLTQAKLDQVMAGFGALRWQAPQRTLLELAGDGAEVVWGPLRFFIDTRAEHGLGDLVLGALLRSVKGETEGRPRQVEVCSRVEGALRVETRLSRLWILPAGHPWSAADCPKDEHKRYNAVLRWGVDSAAAGEHAVGYSAFAAQVKRFLPGALERLNRAWGQSFLDWLGAVARLAGGGEAMKDLNDALKFYDRNREKIESLLQFRAELQAESEAFARRLEAKLRAGGVEEGLTLVDGRNFRYARQVKIGGRAVLMGVEVEVALERLALHVEPVVVRDLETRRRPSSDEAAELLAKTALPALAGDKRINPDNPEALAYQTLKALFQNAAEALAAARG